MIPTHATKAGIRYRYYVSLPHLKGESKTTSVGSVSRIPATDIENIIVKSVNEHLGSHHGQPSSSRAHADDLGLITEQVVRIDVRKDCLIVRFKSAGTEEGSHSADGQILSIPWQKPPSRKSRQILIPLGVPRNEVGARIAHAAPALLIPPCNAGAHFEASSSDASSCCPIPWMQTILAMIELAPNTVRASISVRASRIETNLDRYKACRCIGFYGRSFHRPLSPLYRKAADSI
jgi:site-specific DNA recombinase